MLSFAGTLSEEIRRAQRARLIETRSSAGRRQFDPQRRRQSVTARADLTIAGLPTATPMCARKNAAPRSTPEQAIAGYKAQLGYAVTSWGAPLGCFPVRDDRRTRPANGRRAAEVIDGAVRACRGESRWARNSLRYVRPLRAVLAVFDGAALGGALDLGDWKLPLTATTTGHRFLAPAPLTIGDFASYRDGLRAAHVVIDRAERMAMLTDSAGARAAAEGLTLRADPGLLEVAGLVEWPHPLIGRFDDAFMDMPAEVLTTSMRSHLLLRLGTGRWHARQPLRGGHQYGCRRRPRRHRHRRQPRAARPPSDAKFFWDSDRQASLDSQVLLAEVTFYDKLGGMADKVTHLVVCGDLAAYILAATRAQRRAPLRPI